MVGIANVAPYGKAQQLAAEMVLHSGAAELFSIVKVLGPINPTTVLTNSDGSAAPRAHTEPL